MSIDEFNEDFDRPKKLKRMLDRWRKTKKINSVGLMLNIVIITKSLFKEPFATNHLHAMCGEDNKRQLNTIFVALDLSLDFVNVDHDLLKLVNASIYRVHKN